MNLQKRNCPIEFSMDTKADGWQDFVFKFDNKMIEFTTASSVGEMIGSVVHLLIGLCIEKISLYSGLSDYDVDKKIKTISDENNIIRGLTGSVQFDNEGTILEMTISRNIQPTSDIVDVTFNYNIDEKEYKFKVDIYDLFYAVSKGVTEYIKRFGIMGYYYMAESQDKIDITHFIQIKSLALTHEVIPLIDIDYASKKSSLNYELELLLFEM